MLIFRLGERTRGTQKRNVRVSVSLCTHAIAMRLRRFSFFTIAEAPNIFFLKKSTENSLCVKSFFSLQNRFQPKRSTPFYIHFHSFLSKTPQWGRISSTRLSISLCGCLVEVSNQVDSTISSVYCSSTYCPHYSLIPSPSWHATSPCKCLTNASDDLWEFWMFAFLFGDEILGESSFGWTPTPWEKFKLLDSESSSMNPHIVHQHNLIVRNWFFDVITFPIHFRPVC